MFRCKECQTEYEIKPDYCDCGNDTFDEILPEKAPQPIPHPKRIEKPVLTPKEKTKTPISTKIDAYAIIIFALCILTSFVVIFFIGNPQDVVVEDQPQEVNVSKNLPSINSFWDNTPVKIAEEKLVEQPIKVIEQVLPKAVQSPPPKVSTSKTAQKPVQQKTVQQKPVQKAPTQTTQTTQKQSVQLPKSVTDITNKPAQQTTNNTQTQVAKPQTQTPAPKKLDQTEYAKYKNSLMTRIAQKINFAGVIGDGSCTVSFTMSSTGALTNRKFEKQSDNSTLNDAVYHAMMQTPTFNPPPEGYKGETIRLNVKMYNGTFEVTIN